MYIKFENPHTQHAFEEIAEKGPGGSLKVVRRWRLFGDRAIRGNPASIARLLHENEELLNRRWGRFAILTENAEESAELGTVFYGRLGEVWELEE